MRGVVLGSGITGMLAKELMGECTIIPFGKSRFFSFTPALDDNFIIRDEKIDDFITALGGKPNYLYKTSYSLAGHLFDNTEEIKTAWLAKVFGDNEPAHANIYMRSRGAFFVYDLKVNELYSRLQSKHMPELTQEAKKGRDITIGDHFIRRGNETIEFDWLISTIPLPILMKSISLSSPEINNLKRLPYRYRQQWYLHVETDSLDFEGANQALVVDGSIIFHKVANIAPHRYLFYLLDDVLRPGEYLMQFMPRFDILDGTTITEAIPLGNKPETTCLEKCGIFPVGSYAEWDWCADVGSNIMKLMRVKQAIQDGGTTRSTNRI